MEASVAFAGTSLSLPIVTRTTARKARSKKVGRKDGTRCPYCKKNHDPLPGQLYSPFWNDAKQTWSICYASGKSRKITKGWDSHDEAILKWAAGDLPTGKPEPATVDTSSVVVTDGEQLSVETICSAYLAWLEKMGKSVDTVRSQFKQMPESLRQMTVAELRVDGGKCLKKFVENMKWNPSSHMAFSKRIKAAFNFATSKTEDSLGWIESTPIKRFNTGANKAETLVRVCKFEDKDIEKIKEIAGADFFLAFRILLETGCRPDEFCGVTADDVYTETAEDNSENTKWMVNHKNQKKSQWKGKQRPVYMLSTEMAKITTDAAAANPDGPIFRCADGTPWTCSKLASRLRAITKKIEGGKNRGLNKSEISTSGKKLFVFVPYTARHTFAIRAVGKEWSYQRIATLMGNSAAEIEKTYGKPLLTIGNFVAGIMGK